MEYKDYYKILGVNKKATEKEVKTAYRQLAREYHPDTNPNNPTAEARFKEINEAYEVLSDKDKRSKYDMFGTNYQRWQQQGGAPGGFDFESILNGMRGGNGAQGLNMEDLASMFAGGSRAGGGAPDISDIFGQLFNSSNGPRTASQPLRRHDSTQTVEISLEESYHGATRTLVSAEGERYSIKIPRGAKDGLKLRFTGKGAQGGDLILVIKERKHTTYERDGDDLRAKVMVDVLTATLGGEIKVNTLKGPINLKIMPGTQGGRTVRLRGRGMPVHKKSDQYGNLLVQLNIEVPTHLTAEERALYEELAQLQGNTQPA